MAHNEPSHLGLCCLTFSFSTLHINFFPMDSWFRTKADDKCLKFGSERVKSNTVSAVHNCLIHVGSGCMAVQTDPGLQWVHVSVSTFSHGGSYNFSTFTLLL